MKFPPPVTHEYQAVDLEALAVAFDAIGEVVDTADEQLEKGQHMQAVHLLSGLRVPVPAGLPGRMYLQESQRKSAHLPDSASGTASRCVGGRPRPCKRSHGRILAALIEPEGLPMRRTGCR